MRLDELRERRAQKPFQPFRIYLTDGRSYNILHPNLLLVAEAAIIIGIPAADDPNPIYGDRTEWVRPSLIDRIEQLPPANAPAGG